MKKFMFAAIGSFSMLVVVTSAEAYVGPGAGLSLLGALWGLLATVALALGYLVLWPLRRLRRQRKAVEADASSTDGRNAPRG